ncbi:MAG: SpoIIIAH-like family protein [Suipraeoptans sp.]
MDNKRNDRVNLDKLNNDFSGKLKRKKRKKRIIIAAIIIMIVIVVYLIWRMSGIDADDNNNAQTQNNSTTQEEQLESDVLVDIEKETEEDNNSDVETEIETDTDLSESLLSDEEMAHWRDKTIEVDGETIYIELNTTIEVVDGNKAFIRLINPIFSSHNIKVHIYTDNEAEDTLYMSQMIAPGTVLEAVVLEKELTEDSYPAVVEYTIFDSDDNELGTYPVDVEFVLD